MQLGFQRLKINVIMIMNVMKKTNDCCPSFINEVSDTDVCISEQPMFKMTTQGNDISVITQAQYDALLHRAPANMVMLVTQFLAHRFVASDCLIIYLSNIRP